MEEIEARKVGSLAPKCNLGWSNNFAWKGIDLGVVFTARIGGMAYSATQGILDYYGVSEATAAARDRGGIPINYGSVSPRPTTRRSPRPRAVTALLPLRRHQRPPAGAQPELHAAAEVVPQQGQTHPRLRGPQPLDDLLQGSVRSRISAATGSNYYQNVDYFMLPSTRNLGFNIKLQF